MSCDPAGFVDSANLYAYGRLNPVRFVDPGGTEGIEADRPSTVKDPGGWPRKKGVDRVEDFARWFTSPSFPDSWSARYLRNAAGDQGDTGAQRLAKVLKETSTVVPGLQTGRPSKRWNDEGFNPALQDPWQKSGNQVGHFLTAVNLGFNPGFVSEPQLPISFISQGWAESIRDVFGAPKSVSDESLAIRLIVGHEKVGDLEMTNPLAFFHQYNAATEQDVKVFREAEKALGTGEKLNRDAAYKVLMDIQVGN